MNDVDGEWDEAWVLECCASVLQDGPLSFLDRLLEEASSGSAEFLPGALAKKGGALRWTAIL